MRCNSVLKVFNLCHMSDKESKTLSVALLVTGIICLMILSCCFVWLVVRCERWRRRRKYRPKVGNRYSGIASHIANGQELKDLQPRTLKPSVNLINYASKHSVNSQSIPSLLSMDDSVASEPLYPGRNYEDEDQADYHPARDLSIARILGSFPELPYYQPPSASNSTENVRDTAKVVAPSTNNNIPIPRPRAAPRSNVVDSMRSTNYSVDSSLHASSSVNTAHLNAPQSSNVGSTNTLSSAESLKVEIPGGAIKIRYMTDNFDFTRLRGKKGKPVTMSTPNISSLSEKDEEAKVDKSVLETEV